MCGKESEIVREFNNDFVVAHKVPATGAEAGACMFLLFFELESRMLAVIARDTGFIVEPFQGELEA